MPEYLAPGVYIEETSFRSKSIEGVSTTTTGFIGPCRFGPLDIEPDIVTSLGEFERIYGGRERLEFEDDGEMDGYLWHAVRAFFEEGGKRLYISRVFRPLQDEDETHDLRDRIKACCAWAALPGVDADPPLLRLRARYPGEAGNFRVNLLLKLGQNVLASDAAGVLRLRGMQPFDLVSIGQGGAATSDDFYIALLDERTRAWSFTRATDGVSDEVALESLSAKDEVRRVLLTVFVQPSRGESPNYVASDLALDPRHTQGGTPDSALTLFEAEPPNIIRARQNPLVIEPWTPSNTVTGLDILHALFTQSELDTASAAASVTPLSTALLDPKSSDAARTLTVVLDEGSDGRRPGANEYEGTAPEDSSRKTGLKQFEDIEDISILAAPGSTFGYGKNPDRAKDSQTIINLLISHCQRMHYRIAVIDSGNAQSIAEVRAMRAQLDSSYAALYYPWVRVVDPLTRQEIALPPSGFVAGIYARNDINRAVWKAPANEVVNLAIGFEQLLNKSQQDILNPEGINCFRFFEGRGYRLWGARTISSDPEWKYVNIRRYFAYLERSIDRGTQWAVFEPNGEALWDNVRRTIYDFLLNEWVSGALLGDKPEKAFFVKCDRSTMTQNDLDNGRLICLIGVAALKPAEFVIFRIGQWTSDRKV